MERAMIQAAPLSDFSGMEVYCCSEIESSALQALFGSAFIDGFRCRAAESEPKGEPSRIRFQKSAAKI